MRNGIVALASSLVVSITITAGANEPIALTKVPSAPRAAAEKAAPGVKFTKATFDEANKSYRLKGKDAKGKEVQVYSDATAELVQVKTSAPTTLKEVPKVVIDAHEHSTRRPGRFHFKATKIIRSEQTTIGLDSKTVLYEFIGKNKEGELLRHVVREDGTPLGLGEAKD